MSQREVAVNAMGLWRGMSIAIACMVVVGSVFTQRSPGQFFPRGRRGPVPAPPPASAPAVPLVPVNDEQVVQALKRGADYLLASSSGNNWEERNWQRDGQNGGETALVLYALLTTGQSLRDDPEYGPKLSFRSKELAPAIAWLSKINAQETYTAALQASTFSMIPINPEDRAANNPKAVLQRAFGYLSNAMGPQGGYTYGYAAAMRGRGFGPGGRDFGGAPPNGPIGDLSNAQYGALGMWALADAGIPVPLQYWRITDRFWRLLQSPSGSWCYSAGSSRLGQERDSMGVAGIATLFVTKEFLDTGVRSSPLQDNNLSLGLSWLNQNFKPETGDLYYLYGVERVGLASGMKFFGTTDWYRQGTANIIAHQQSGGFWDQMSWPETFFGATPITSTSYALLFLARGRNPILFNKLEYDGPWNARPRDDANLTRNLSKRFERPLNWQSVNLNVDPKEWMDAPILLITGSKDPKFTNGDIDKLRTFVEAGGLIFSTADEGNVQFTNAMRKYAGQLSRGIYEMRQLPPAHLLYSPELGATITSKGMLLGMSNGVRELWIHSTADMSASWQLQRTTSKDHFEIPVALYFYATGKMPLRAKLKTMDFPEPSAPASRTLTLARVTYSGNSDPEPAAWPRLAKALRLPHQAGDGGIDLQISSLNPTELDPQKTPVAHLTGTAHFLVKPEEVTAWRTYLDHGGLLIADAAGGSETFAESFWQLMQRVYPEAKPTPLPPDHPVFNGAFSSVPGTKIEDVELRKFAAVTLGKRITQPVIQSLSVNGRPCVLFSQLDITSGLLGTNTWGILGYGPDDAPRIAENLIRWALDQQKR